MEDRRAERLAASRAAQAAAADGSEGGDGAGELDLNRVTFEALRALGLSVNQTARFIGQREAGRGFRSLDDLDRLYGLPDEVVELLKSNGSV